MPHLTAAAAYALAPTALFAWADRTVGGAGRRSLAFGLVLLAGVLAWWGTHSVAPAAIALAWIVYRSLPWKIGGGTTPHGSQIVGAFLRHALPALAAIALFAAGVGPVELAASLLVYALVATILAVAYATQVDRLAARGNPETGQANKFTEIVRGAAFGLLVAIGLIFASGTAQAQTQPAPSAPTASGSAVATQPVSLFVAPPGGGQGKGTVVAPDNPLPVMGDVAMITVTPTVSASPAYSSGDAMGGLLTFANAALRSGGGGLIQAVTVHFKTAQTAPVDFLWCGASNLSSTTLTDNGAVSVAAADFAACRAVHVTDCTSLGTPTVCSADNLAFPYVLSTGTTGYGFLITRGSQTLGSTSDVSVSIRILRQ